MNRLLLVFTICLGSLLSPVSARAEFTVDVEGGVVSSGYNDVKIPGDVGTEISLSEDLSTDEAGFWRLRLGTKLGEKHKLSLLVAPLRLKAAGSVDRVLDYNGATFPSGEQLEARYRFDSYRLSYTYGLVQTEKLKFGLGFTAKVRDAAIKIESATESSEKTNTGFVPLINFSLDWRLSGNFGLIVDGDALAAPQGRAEDVLVAFYSDVSDKLRLRAGYRLLEGGADNDEVYNFTLLNYFSAGITVSL